MSIVTQIIRLNNNIEDMKMVKQKIKNTVNNDFDIISNEQIEDYAELIEDGLELYKDYIPSIETTQSTEITVDNAMKYSKNKLELFGNTEQDNTKMTYKCDGTETGNYYLTYDSTDYYFTMPIITERDILVFNTTDLKLYLGDIEITTESTGTGINLTFIAAPNPNYPQDIHIVTGNNIITCDGKNLLNPKRYLTKPERENYIEYKDEVFTVIKANYNTQSYIFNNLKLDPIKFEDGFTFFAIVEGTHASGNLIFYNTKGEKIGSELIINTSNTKKVFRKHFITKVLNSIKWFDPKNTVGTTYKFFILPGNVSTADAEFVKYTGKEFELNLGNIELCKIDTTKDILFKNEPKNNYYNPNLIENAWYIHKNIQKVILNGSEYCQYTDDTFLFDFIIDYKLSTNNICICSHYLSQECVTSTSEVQDKHITFRNDSTTKRLYIKDSNITSLNDFKAWLSSNNITLYYELNAPIDTQITDENLISQLNELYENVELDKGINNITSTSEDLEPYMKLTYKNI